MRVRFEDFELDSERLELQRGGARIDLQPKVFALLAHLVRHRERVVPKAELFASLWPEETVTEASLTSAIRAAREALGDDGAAQRTIATLRGRGYRFVARVEEEPREPEAAGEGFVGREAALELALASLEKCAVGRPQVLLLAGEPGIGKTRTAEEVAARAQARGARICFARCTGGEGAPALRPWMQLLRALCEGRGRGELASLLGAGAPTLAGLVPEIRERLGGLPEPLALETPEARFRLFDATTDFLRRAAQERPLVLVLDDLHLADEASLLLLRFLVGELRDARLFVLGTYRDAALVGDSARSEALADVARGDPTRALELEGVSHAELARLVETRVGSRPAPGFVAALLERTGGNPLFAIQLLRVLELDGGLAGALAGGPWTAALPRPVREAIGRRLEAHTPRCHEVLVTASVLGREFSLGALAALTGLELPVLLEVLGEAVAARLVAATPGRMGRYRFAHTLLRDALYAELGPAERIQLHERAASYVAELHASEPDPPLAELAHHLVAAASRPESLPRAVDACRRAAAQASARFAFAEAAAHCVRALGVLELTHPVDEALRCELLISLGEAQARAYGPERARESVERAAHLARRLGSPDQLARAALVPGGRDLGDGLGTIEGTRVVPLEEALAAVGPADSPLRVRLLSRVAVSLNGRRDAERCRALCDEALACAGRLRDPGLLAVAQHASYAGLSAPDGLASRTALAAEIQRNAEAAGDRELALDARLWLAADLLEQGKVSALDAGLEGFHRLARDFGSPQSLWLSHVLRAMRALLDGRLDEGEALARQALDLGPRVGDDDPSAAVVAFASQLTALGFERGLPAELEPILWRLAQQGPAPLLWRAALARVLAAQGRADSARQELERLAARDFADLPRDRSFIPALSLLAETATLLADAPRAALLYDLLLPYAGRAVVLGPGAACLGSAARSLGLLATALGRPDDAERQLEAAVAANARLGARPYRAHAEHDLARALALRGRAADRERALSLAARAAAEARELGMTPLAERARALHLELAGVAALDPRRRVER